MSSSLNVLKKSNKPLPVLYEHKELCCGCTACYAICREGAISMEPDEEGFNYPVLDEEKCVRCYICLKVCPIKKKIAEKEADMKA